MLSPDQATAGEDDEDDDDDEDESLNIERDRAALMHATSGSGMHAIEVCLPRNDVVMCARLCRCAAAMLLLPRLSCSHAVQAAYSIEVPRLRCNICYSQLTRCSMGGATEAHMILFVSSTVIPVLTGQGMP